MRFEMSLSTMRLCFDPVMGRRTVYVNLTVFGWTLWIMRWDCGRAPTCWTLDGLMGWTFGIRKSV